jgi:hypothetical protein
MIKVISSIIYIYFISLALNYNHVVSCANTRQIIRYKSYDSLNSLNSLNSQKNISIYPDNSSITLRNVSKDIYLNRKSKFCHIKCDCFFSHSTKNDRYRTIRWAI